jgi:hypothetical protein
METPLFVLVHADNRAVADCIVYFLKRAGYQARTVTSPSDAAGIACEPHPNLLIVDSAQLEMKEAGAWSLLEDIPVVQLTRKRVAPRSRPERSTNLSEVEIQACPYFTANDVVPADLPLADPLR